MTDIQQLIDINSYEGIRDMDGWETLELTVRDNHSPAIARAILQHLGAEYVDL